MEWWNKLTNNPGDFFKSGLISGEKPNWIGLGTTAALMGGVLLFGQTLLGPLGLVAATLLAGAVGLGIGGALSDGIYFSNSTSEHIATRSGVVRDAPQVTLEKTKPVMRVVGDGADRKLDENFKVPVIDESLITEQYGDILNNQKIADVHFIAKPEERAEYANDANREFKKIAILLGTAETLDKTLDSEQYKDTDLAKNKGNLNQFKYYKDELDKIKAGRFIPNKPDHIELRSYMNKFAADNDIKLDEASFAERLAVAESVVQDRIFYLRHKTDDSAERGRRGWVTRDDTANADNGIKRAIQLIDDGKLDRLTTLINEGTADDGMWGSLKAKRNDDDVGIVLQTRAKEIVEIARLMEMREEIYDLKERAISHAQKSLSTYNNNLVEYETKQQKAVKEFVETQQAAKADENDVSANLHSPLPEEVMNRKPEGIDSSNNIQIS